MIGFAGKTCRFARFMNISRDGRGAELIRRAHSEFIRSSPPINQRRHRLRREWPWAYRPRQRNTLYRN